MVAAFYFILSMYILSFSKQVSSVCYEPGIWCLESNPVLAFRTQTNAIIPHRQYNSVHTKNCVCVYICYIYIIGGTNDEREFRLYQVQVKKKGVGFTVE